MGNGGSSACVAALASYGAKCQALTFLRKRLSDPSMVSGAKQNVVKQSFLMRLPEQMHTQTCIQTEHVANAK